MDSQHQSDEETRTRTAVSPSEATPLLEEATGCSFRPLGPLPGGETGGQFLADSSGQRHVLKCETDPGRADLRRTGAELAERLRVQAGWPVPAQQLFPVGEVLLILQAFLPGATVDHLTHRIVDDVEELHQRRLSLELEASGTWAEGLLETLVVGGDGYCLHEPLRTYDDRTRRIVERIEEIGHSVDPGDLPGHHVIHGDLHPGNMLQLDGALSAVVDLDYARLGDASFDLVMLAVSSLSTTVEAGVRTRLFRSVHALADGARNAYLAHLLLRCLDWPIRKGRTREVEFWIERADELLP